MSKENEIKMFGATIEELREGLNAMIDPDPKMLSMSYISDAQEEMAHGHYELARQSMNRAKFYISDMLEARPIKEGA